MDTDLESDAGISISVEGEGPRPALNWHWKSIYPLSETHDGLGQPAVGMALRCTFIYSGHATRDGQGLWRHEYLMYI